MAWAAVCSAATTGDSTLPLTSSVLHSSCRSPPFPLYSIESTVPVLLSLLLVYNNKLFFHFSPIPPLPFSFFIIILLCPRTAATGDMYPCTGLGQLVGACASVIGVCIFALPAGACSARLRVLPWPMGSLRDVNSTTREWLNCCVKNVCRGAIRSDYLIETSFRFESRGRVNGMAPAHTPVFLSQKPSNKNGIIRPVIVFLAWYIIVL